MRWFRKQDEVPRLLSLSPLRNPDSNPDDLPQPLSTSESPLDHPVTPKNIRHRSRIDMTPSSWARRHYNKDTNFYNVEESLVIVERADRRRHKSQPRQSKSVENSHFREKRNPLLDKVKHTRLSCFRSNSNASTDLASGSANTDPCPTTSSPDTIDIDQVDLVDSAKQYDTVSRASCFTAKLKAMSEKYLQSSTNKFLNKIYKGQETLTPKTKKKISKKRSFSYGALPDLESFQNTANPLFQEHATQDEDRLLLVDNEDSDSGILVNDSSFSSGFDSFTRTSPEPDTESKSKKPHRALSLDRRELFRNSLCIDNTDVDVPTSPSTSYNKNVMVVRIPKETSSEELGIFISKSRLISHGYFVAHIVPEGAAARESSLMVGDEIVSVNGTAIAGLTMIEAKQLLCMNSDEIELVVIRSSLMKETSVDFDNNRHSMAASPSGSYSSSPLYKRQPYFQKNSTIHGSYNRVLRKSHNLKASEPFPVSPKLMETKAEPATTNFCTLPRRPCSSICTFHTVRLEKGAGKKSLGFTIVGGRDSPKGALSIFVKTIMHNGQAAEEGTLRAGDEILAVNGQVCHDISHAEAVLLFKSVKTGPITLQICRRKKAKASGKTKSCSSVAKPN